MRRQALNQAVSEIRIGRLESAQGADSLIRLFDDKLPGSKHCIEGLRNVVTGKVVAR